MVVYRSVKVKRISLLLRLSAYFCVFRQAKEFKP
jgi:hypothetical protein